MNSTTLICKRCKAPLEYDDTSNIVRCPHCGYSEMIDETDTIKQERIRARAYKEAEIGKSKIKSEETIAKQNIKLEEKRLGVTRIKVLIFATLMAVFLLAGVLAGYKYYHKDDIKIPLSYTDYRSKDYKTAENLFRDAGFSNIESIPTEDLGMDRQDQAGRIIEVSVNGDTSFSAGKWFPKSSKVTIKYHAMDPERVNDKPIPHSSDEYATGEYGYIEVYNSLQKDGFTNITLIPDYKRDKNYKKEEDGHVRSVIVNKEQKYYKGKWYP